MTLNGWRRLGLALCGAWCFGVISLATYEIISRQDGYFVELTLPAGAVVTGNHVTLPDGRIIDINLSIGGKDVKPWEIKWDNEPEVPTEQFIRWKKLLLVLLAIPFGLWGCFEVLAFIGGWISSGFREHKSS
jgi:hypothetical protein